MKVTVCFFAKQKEEAPSENEAPPCLPFNRDPFDKQSTDNAKEFNCGTSPMAWIFFSDCCTTIFNTGVEIITGKFAKCGPFCTLDMVTLI